jgi:hypothetical protein
LGQESETEQSFHADGQPVFGFVSVENSFKFWFSKMANMLGNSEICGVLGTPAPGTEQNYTPPEACTNRGFRRFCLGKVGQKFIQISGFIQISF